MNRPLRILILDNNRETAHFGSGDLVMWALKMSPPGTEVWVRRPPDADFPVGIDYDGMILSGSVTSCLQMHEPWIKPYDDYVGSQIKLGRPILGVCYGHQTLARCLFSEAGIEPKLGLAKDAEHGWQKITRTADSEIFEGLGNEFFTYQSHYEEVTELPPRTRHLAQSERSFVQAFQITGKPIYGVQFHPEYNVEDAEASMLRKLKRGVRKDWILNVGRGPKLYDENVGKTIFGNFIKITEQYRKR